MQKKRSFLKNKLAASISIALVASPLSINAQSQENNALEEEIIVTGIRGSLQRAQTVKMNSSSVVEAISAEDIGKLPDSSIAESLARLPGLAGERRNGRTSGIAVRGFNEDFVSTTMNGRELLGIGENRGVEYDLYPSEMISGAVVHKTADASLPGAGIGGSVDLQTIRPLDAPSTASATGSFEKNELGQINPDFDDTGHRYALTYSDNYADGKFGLAVTYASTESPSQTQYADITRFTQTYTNAGITSGSYEGAIAPGGIVVANRSRVLERDTLSAVLQFAPTDKITATLDYLDIDFSDIGVTRGLWDNLGNQADGSNVISAEEINGNTVITSAVATHLSVLRTEPFRKQGDLETIGLNVEFELSDAVSLEFDYASSETSKVEEAAESYAGVGRPTLAQGDPSVLTWVASDRALTYIDDANNVNYADASAIKLAGPQAWGGGAAGFADEIGGSGPTGVSQAQDGFGNTVVIEEELDTFRLEATIELDSSIFTSVNFGINYRDQTKSKNNQGFFFVDSAFPSDRLIPDEYIRGTSDLSWAGRGLVIAYDSQAVIDNGEYAAYDAQLVQPNRFGDTYTVEETVITPFVKLDFETEMSTGVRVFGNLGLQYVDSEQSREAIFAFQRADLFVETSPLGGGAEYSNLLPSMNINFDLSGGHMMRLALAKVLTRPRIDNLGIGDSIAFNTGLTNVQQSSPTGSSWTSLAGDPELEPYEATQFDMSYEWYYSDLGYVSAAFFYKDLTNWNTSVGVVRDYEEFYIPGFHQGVQPDGTPVPPATFLGIDTRPQGGQTGDVSGLELQTNLQFGEFVEALDGLGLVISGSFSDGELDDGSGIPGLSEKVISTTLFYQIGGFEARVAMTDRDDFLSQQRGGSNSISPVNRRGATLVDAQISYDFADTGIAGLEGLRVSLQGQNLTDEENTFEDSSSGQVLRNERYGSNYLLTFNYSIW